MCASLHKKSTVCKQDVLSVRILSTRRFNKKPELHAMLHQPKCTQPTPLTQPAWNAYLNRRFRPPAARGVQLRGLGLGSGLSARDMAVLLGRNPPPSKFCYKQQGAQNEWMPAPDTIVQPPSSGPLVVIPCLRPVPVVIGRFYGAETFALT